LKSSQIRCELTLMADNCLF